ncbi:hypothetical protein M0R89_21175 (plasmid) [Halorussus limi]|uniref:Uncharacterized protein n=1 Tax=Halorussus limi TaxID=2938695 RepID=A0A8U0I0A4_9EURY|nr:hypothetical protein [Halorussus limi]UPV76710.1 hypothetical protein M0R89_21175 [Halorussus limi]
MPSNSRRHFLAVASTTGLAGLAGCAAFGGSRPDVNPATGLARDTSQALDDEAVYVAGDDNYLPNPPTTTESIEDADAVLATETADRTKLANAFRAGKPVAVAGGGATGIVQTLLDSVQEDYSFGVEIVRARPVKVVVADPRGETVETYTFVAEGGWDEPILDPFGWVLVGRVPECDTFVPESSMDDMFEYAGAAHIAGRFPTGETYVSRSEASVNRQDAGLFIRLRTKLHAAANDGYAVEKAVREADFADDKRLTEVYPNAHTQNGVQVANVSDTTRSTFVIEITPANSRARSTLTGCGGLQTGSGLAYDHRTSFQWKRDRLLGTDRRYGSATGRGEWAFNA